MAGWTGASHSIGEATARLFVAHGAKVVIADVLDELGQSLAEELGADRARYVHCDVRNESDVAAAVDLAVSTFGKLDIYYSNAGIVDLNIDDYEAVFAVNVRGTILGIKHAARVMKASKHGSIILTASVGGVVAGLGPSAYSISKAAVVGIARSVAFDLRGHDICVNCISPGGLPTTLAFNTLREFDPGMTMPMLEEKTAKGNEGSLAGSNFKVETVANCCNVFWPVTNRHSQAATT